jgi:cytochrome c
MKNRNGSCVLMLAACLAPLLAACAPADAHLDRGQRLLATYQCGTCHRIPGVSGARGTVGPSLDGFGRRSYIAGQIPNLPANLVRWIHDPQALLPGTLMPNMGVSEADARDMAAYLGSLAP